jgi:hypothetical protein
MGVALAAMCLMSAQAQRRNEIQVPNLNGYTTLKCDFHMHSVFSDGLVWPTVRVDEAYREGLDAISLTEHIEYRPHKKDIIADHNRSYELSQKQAKKLGILLIRGSEITRSMPPGHFNAIFLNDSNWNKRHIKTLSMRQKNKEPLSSGIIRAGHASSRTPPCGGLSIHNSTMTAACTALK